MIQRKVKQKIINALKKFRVVILSGPRQAGKTTLVKEISKELDMEYYSFDDSEILSTAMDNPKNFIKFISKDSCTVDEVQYIPSVIPPLKMIVDEKNKKGMFLLTGSSDIQRMSSIKESLAGRMVGLELYPLSIAEINYKKQNNIIDLLFSDDIFKINIDSFDIKDFTNTVLQGGYPEIINLDEDDKSLWFGSYINSRIIKDARDFENIHANKAHVLKDLLELLAFQVSSLISYSNISKKLKIADKTVAKYIYILESMYIVKEIRPYFNNKAKQLTKAKKLHFIDTGLVANLLGADLSMIVNNGSVFGKLVESFVFSELLKQNTFSLKQIKIYHYRDNNQKEVDLVLESKNAEIIGIEIKSGTNIKSSDTKGLISLANHAKEKFLRGYIFYGGDKILPFSKDGVEIYLVPLGVLNIS